MADLVVLRLHPSDPMAAADFTSLLTGLTVTVHDLSFGDGVDGVLLGTATGVADAHLGDTVDDTVDVEATGIMQHYLDVVPVPLSPAVRVLESVATAVVVATPPAGHPEYPGPSSWDLRIELTTTSGGSALRHDLDFNVEVTTVGALPTNQKTYFAMTPSAYVELPAALAASGAALVDLPPDGQPPAFTDLVTAIDTVLAADPGTTLAAAAPLTPAQSQHVASEIVWNRAVVPPPQPDPTLGADPFGALYTDPPAEPGLDPDDVEKGRAAFEAQSAGYAGGRRAAALRLTGFVHSAAAAVVEERLTRAATQAAVDVPLLTGAPGDPRTVTVGFHDTGGLTPSFEVPAAALYALAATLPPQVGPEQRYAMARLATEEQLLTDLAVAVDAGVLDLPAAPFDGGPALGAAQVARRLVALGRRSTPVAELALTPPVTTLVDAWLAHPGPTATIVADLWTPLVAAHTTTYLQLVLRALTQDTTALVTAVQGPPLSVGSVPALVAVSDQAWRDLFAAPGGTALLPDFTRPGNPTERAEAFVRHLRAFFALPVEVSSATAPTVDAAPLLPRSSADLVAAFVAAYPAHAGGTAFDVATYDPVADAAAAQATAAAVLPGDPTAQAWLVSAVGCVTELWALTDVGAGSLRFSLVEALYARGFTSVASVRALTLADLQHALVGSVAFPFAAALHARAGGAAPTVPPDTEPHPVNPVDASHPDGTLTDCIPPEHLSPVGLTAYLHELLRVGRDSTCDDPLPADASGSLGTLLAARRGPLADLLASPENLTVRLPVVDLVDESLEALVAGSPGADHGVVHDTHGEPGHDTATWRRAVPEHSSPATPVAAPDAYERLRTDFSAPTLPYDQPLDVNRTLLGEMGTSRVSVLRHFRRDVTESPVDAEHQPAGFVAHQWRYPVSLPVALEYLGVSEPEYDAVLGAGAPVGLDVLSGLGADGLGLLLRRPTVPGVLDVLGLEYCDLVDLQASGIVPFGLLRRRGGQDGRDDGPRDDDRPSDEPRDDDPRDDEPRDDEPRDDEPRDDDPRDDDPVDDGPLPLPSCPPCCLDDLVLDLGEDPAATLRRLVVVTRLWAKVRVLPSGPLGLDDLADVLQVLPLFDGDDVLPGFARQLVALLLLRDAFCVPLHAPDVPRVGVGASRSHLLGLWLDPAGPEHGLAVGMLLRAVDALGECLRPERSRPPELDRLRPELLDPLAVLVGFTDVDRWDAQPTSTLRFTEVLLKLTVSDLTAGEALFVFADRHVTGDDPFRLPSEQEATEDPLALPDDEAGHDLWALRAALLAVGADDVDTWDWPALRDALVDDLGYDADVVAGVGAHVLPDATTAGDDRRWTVPLAAAATTPAMWERHPRGPFRYDATAQELWTQLPVDDAQVAQQLSTLRPLAAAEQAAVRDLWAAPRLTLQPLAAVLAGDGPGATVVEALVHEPDEDRRRDLLTRAVVRTLRRADVVAEHVAAHVRTAAGDPAGGAVGAAEVRRLLRATGGDENRALGPWEDDSGAPPAVRWPGAPGGALAALLAVTGAGLVGELAGTGGPVWRDLWGPSTAFGEERDAWNAPAPTLVPGLGLTLTPDQLRYAAVRNGFALRDEDGEPLHGAEPFVVTWRGALLVEETGEYEFHAGAPTPPGELPDPERCPEHEWQVRLTRGSRSHLLLDRGGPDGTPDHASGRLRLRRGVYDVEVVLRHTEPRFDDADRVRARSTGFQLKYTGPDTRDVPVEVPRSRLYRQDGATPLDHGLQAPGAAHALLAATYGGSLRDVRRTYQRVFKAALLVHRLGLTATPLPDDPQSELGHLLDHAATFAGVAYPRTGPTTFGVHRAWFDPDLLPVVDPYRPPTLAQDARTAPSAHRQAALFDTWERLTDYVALRRDASTSLVRPVWRMFHAAVLRQPDEPADLVRHLGVDASHAPLVLTYADDPVPFEVDVEGLESEVWAVRAWRAETWLTALEAAATPADTRTARPHEWAATLPDDVNLTDFWHAAALGRGVPRRYADVTAVDDALRLRARDALVTWCCRLDRVPLPFRPGAVARVAGDLSDLLLQDVLTTAVPRLSRVEEAISAVQAFVQRARLGLEPDLVPSPAFLEVWDERFADHERWRCATERDLYREDWVEWDELRRAQDSEAFRMLQEELREAKLGIAVPGGLEWWPGGRPPVHPGLRVLQDADPSTVRVLDPGPLPEGLDLRGTPVPQGEPVWVAPFGRGPLDDWPDDPDDRPDDDPDDDRPDDDRPDDDRPDDGPVPLDRPAGGGGVLALRDVRVGVGAVEVPADELERLPLWLRAVAGLGTRWVRVAAAGVPPASAHLAPLDEHPCGCGCGGTPDLVDEYWFWLMDARTFLPVAQDPDVGLDDDGLTDWHRDESLPGLLAWDPEPAVHLYWTRVRGTRADRPSRSAQAVRVDPSLPAPGEVPELLFTGRTGDSLYFDVSGGVAPVGHADPAAPGFRYDLATDVAHALPLVAAPPAPPTDVVAGLPAYPFLVHVRPGAPVLPLTDVAVAFTVAAELRALCRHEAALAWYELVLDPLRADNRWGLCGRGRTPGDVPDSTVPDGSVPGGSVPDSTNPDGSANPDGVPGTTVPGGPAGPGRPDGTVPGGPGRPDGTVPRRPSDGTCCPTVAPDDDVARARAVLLAWLETVLDRADVLASRPHLEALRAAQTLVEVVARLLGPRPRTVQGHAGDPVPVGELVPADPRLNPRLVALWARTDDRRAELGAQRDATRLDAGDEPRPFGTTSTGPGCCAPDGTCQVGCSPFRFTTWAQKAGELAQQAAQLGATLLGALERGEDATLQALLTSQRRQVDELAVSTRQLAYRSADLEVQALEKAKEGALARLRNVEKLLADGLNAGEIGHGALTGVSTGSRAAGNVSEAIAQGMGMVPDMWMGVAGVMGTPLQFNQLPVGSKLAGGFATAARILQSVAEIATSGANLSQVSGAYDRREADWRQQVVETTIQIEQIERQILAAQRRRDAALHDVHQAELARAHTAQVDEYLRDRFTRPELYLYLQRETAALYRRAYDLALATARTAERRLNFELGHTRTSYVGDHHWTDLRAGLPAADRLALDVRAMEHAYLEQSCREYELTKHVSLRQHFPDELVRLLASGVTEVELPEWLFDGDYPGHYMRRARNVALNVPAVAPPYAGVRARLTLLSGTTRVDPSLGPVVEPCCDHDEPGPCGCAHPPEEGYAPTPDDPRVVRTWGGLEAIATSTGQSDSGLFEVSFRDERYLPFELAGVAGSRWRIEVPPENNGFDLDAMSDVVLTVSYTAREGGSALRAAAARAAAHRLPGDGRRLLDLRRDLPDAWAALTGRPVDGYRSTDLRLSGLQFGHVPGRRVRWVEGLDLYVEAPHAEPGASVVVRFHPACGCDDDGPHPDGPHLDAPRAGDPHDCGCDRVDVVCVASRDLPGLFHGTLDLSDVGRLGPLDPVVPRSVGRLEVDASVVLCDLYLVARYCADPAAACGPEEGPGCGCTG